VAYFYHGHNLEMSLAEGKMSQLPSAKMVAKKRRSMLALAKENDWRGYNRG
jgi:hypothetical protein